jgi:CTP:molybdopterin cytidylyltransferase MocA
VLCAKRHFFVRAAPAEPGRAFVMGTWTAIVLAGQRPGETEFPARFGLTAKALIPIDGEPMVARVVRALLASPSIGRVVLLSQAAEALRAGAPAWLSNEPRVVAAEAGDGISSSIAAIAGADPAPWPLLVTTADHPLLTPDMVESFLRSAAGADVAFAMVERKTVETAYPETRRTWLKFSDGHYSGANLFALTGESARTALTLWSRAEQDRKKALKLLAYFGPMIFFRALTRTISLDAATAKVGRSMMLRLKAVRLPFADAAIDVDKPADHALVTRILAGRAGDDRAATAAGDVGAAAPAS